MNYKIKLFENKDVRTVWNSELSEKIGQLKLPLPKAHYI